MATRKTKSTSAKKAKTTKKTSKKTTQKTRKSAAAPTKHKTAKKITKKTQKKSGKSAAPVTLTYDMIADRAYVIWETTGCVSGRDMENWRLAEAQLKAELGIE